MDTALAGKVVPVTGARRPADPDAESTPRTENEEMPATREQMVAAVAEYCRAETEKDKDAWLALFADGAVHEDPVGVRTNAGLEQIAGFWDLFQPLDLEIWCEEPTIVCGHEAIAIMRCRTGPPEDRRTSNRIVDQFVFDDAGKITNLRAFYVPSAPALKADPED
jgi:steroid Delta-isomerase